MRLIDADELKQTIYEWRYHGYYDKLIEVIDNAPTVDRQAINAEWLKAGIEYAETHRPQGEWARHDEWRNGEYIGGFYHINCPEIEKGTALFSKWETNYCPNCGADMRG